MGLVLSVLSALTIGLVTIVCREWLFPLLRVRSALSNLDGPPVDNWWTGNWHQLFNKEGWAFKKHISDTYGTALKINAVGWDQQVYLTDPLAITSIFQTDRASYETARYHLLRSRLSFGWGLVGTSGEKHRKQRRLMAPFFSSNYLRTLMPLFYPFAYELADYMKAQAEKNGNILEMHSIISGAALEYVGAGLGYRFDVLNEARRGFYSDAARNINPLTFRLSTFRSFLPYMVKLGPPWFRKALIDWIPWRAAQELKAEIYKIDAVAQDILQTRRQAFADGEGYGRDILSAIMRWNDEADEDEKIDDLEIISHITTTLFAGHETTAGTLSRIFYQLAACPDAQERLREECTKARLEKGDLEFEDLLALPYLDAICKETLRVFPPVDQLYRTATKQTVLPLLFPVIGKDGKEVREIPIEAGTETISTIIGYNRNPHVWGEDAEEWIPDRWLEEPRESVLKAKLPAIFSHMMTFTLGERHCIGYKFAEMEMKLILTVLLPRFKIELDPNSEIYWNMGGSIAPVVKGSNSIEPTLPMKITPIPNPKV